MSLVRFRVSLVSLQKRFFATNISRSSSSSVSLKVESPYTDHLIKSYGLLPESAAAISTKLKLNDDKLANCDSVVNVLKAHGFSTTQIAQIILKRPSLLVSKVSILTPKLNFLQDNGVTGDRLTELIMTSPDSLGRSLECNMQPCFDILRKVLGNEDKVLATVKRSTKVLCYSMSKYIQPNIDLMVSQGVPLSIILNFIPKQPRTFMLKPERVAYAIDKVNELGIEPTSPMYLHTIRAVLSMSQVTWDKKMEIFKSLELSEKEIMSIFTRYPFCLTLSEEKIRASWNFFVNEVKCDWSTIVANPKFLMFALETRVRPRFHVFKALKSLGLVSEKMQFSTMLQRNDKEFIERFIIRNQKMLPDLMDLYRSTAPSIVKGKKHVNALKGRRRIPASKIDL